MADKPIKLLDQVRDKLRLKNYSLATEKTYIGWSRRYNLFQNKHHPAGMGKAELETFLINLAPISSTAARAEQLLSTRQSPTAPASPRPDNPHPQARRGRGRWARSACCRR